MARYIPPQANANQALVLLHSFISKQQDAYFDGALVVARDFNQVNLKIRYLELDTYLEKKLSACPVSYQGFNHPGSVVHKY